MEMRLSEHVACMEEMILTQVVGETCGEEALVERDADDRIH
jgi:hypothetical protein